MGKHVTFTDYALLPSGEEGVATPTKKRGVSFCSVIAIILALLAAVAAVCAAGGYLWIRHQVERFTVKDPISFPIEPLPEEELEVIKDRAKLFYDLLKAGHRPAGDFVLTQDEINGFVADSDYLRGNAYVHVSDNTITTDMSLPAEFLPGGRGRYFVASGFVSVATKKAHDAKTLITAKLDTHEPVEGLDGPVFYAELLGFVAADGEYNLHIDKGNFLNWVVPQDYIDRRENILDCDDCDEIRTVIAGIESVSIENHKITVHVRRDDETLPSEEKVKPAAEEGSSSSSGGNRRRLLTRSAGFRRLRRYVV